MPFHAILMMIVASILLVLLGGVIALKWDKEK
jgi:Flp pilus assembly protein TadG